jgi:hypothetical protein
VIPAEGVHEVPICPKERVGNDFGMDTGVYECFDRHLAFCSIGTPLNGCSQLGMICEVVLRAWDM